MEFFTESVAGLELSCSRPLSTAAGRPLVVGLHGRGSRPKDLSSVVRTLSEDYLHVLPHAPLPMGEGRAWYLTGPERDAGFAKARGLLLELMTELRRRTGTGPERTAVWGFSQGGVLALEVGLRAPSALAAVVALSAKLDAGTAADGAVLSAARKRRLLLVHGVRDTVVPHTASREAFQALTGAGVEVELAELPMGHELGPLPQAALRGFLESVLTVFPTARA